MKILMNFLGIAIFFLLRFNGRSDKATQPSLVYWGKDNWVELVVIMLFDIAFMILAVFGGLQIDFTKMLPTWPDWITIGGDLALSFGIGLFGAYSGYTLIKAKVDYTKEPVS